jgi:hypothetical protein
LAIIQTDENQKNTSKTIRNTNRVGHAAIARGKQALYFARCKQAVGSRILITYPAQCVTKDGKTFTDVADAAPSYLLIKEWGIAIKLTDADKMTYKFTGTQGVSLRLIPVVTPISDCHDLGSGTCATPDQVITRTT